VLPEDRDLRDQVDHPEDQVLQAPEDQMVVMATQVLRDHQEEREN